MKTLVPELERLRQMIHNNASRDEVLRQADVCLDGERRNTMVTSLVALTVLVVATLLARHGLVFGSRSLLLAGALLLLAGASLLYCRSICKDMEGKVREFRSELYRGYGQSREVAMSTNEGGRSPC